MSRETKDYPGAAGDWNAQEQRREAVRRYADRRADAASRWARGLQRSRWPGAGGRKPPTK